MNSAVSRDRAGGVVHRLRDIGFWSLPLLAIGFLAAYPSGGGPTLCPFALITGTACPGCGLTRAASALVRGEFGLAFTLHPLVPVVLVWLAGMWLAGLYRRRGRRFPLRPTASNVLLLATTLVFVVAWVLRLTMGSLPPV